MAFLNKPKAAQEPAMPRRKFSPRAIQEMWWGLFTDLLTIPIDSDDALRHASNNAPETIASARALADAAVEEFEKRWAE